MTLIGRLKDHGSGMGHFHQSLLIYFNPSSYLNPSLTLTKWFQCLNLQPRGVGSDDATELQKYFMDPSVKKKV